MNWEYIKNIKHLKKVIGYCKETGVVCFDFETTGLEYYDELHYPTIIGLSFQPGYVYILPLGHSQSPFKDEFPQLLRLIGDELLENPDVVKIAYNSKFEQKWFMRYGCKFIGRVFDPMIAKYLLDEERPHDLKSTVARFEPKQLAYEDELLSAVRKLGWDRVDMDLLSTYCANDVDLSLKLMIRFEGKLMDNGFYNIFRSEKMPLATVLAEAEFMGTLIDKEYLESLIQEYQNKIKENELELRKNITLKKFEKHKHRQNIQDLIEALTEEIENLKDTPNSERKIREREAKISRIVAGELVTKKEKAVREKFNFKSPQQLIELLFENSRGFKFPILEYTESGAPSTAESTVMKLQSKVKKKNQKQFLANLLKSRELEKIYSTYIKGIYDKLDNNSHVHTSYLIHGTTTQRLSSREPNLQNIPRELTNNDIKKMFIPPQGYIIVEFDFGQAELRILAEMAKDPVMIDIFKKGWNIHVATACKMFKGDYDKVKGILSDDKHPEWATWEKRKKIGKSMNFSIIYLQGDRSTAEQMGITIEEAKKFKRDWFNGFPQVEPFIKKTFKRVERDGFVKTMFGAKRRLPNIYDPRPGVQFEAMRQSINSPIQGTSGQYTNMSLVMIREAKLRGELPKDMRLAWTVHDSIGLYIKPEDVVGAVPKIISIMENPETKKYFGFEMSGVRMKASAEVGPTWGEIRDYNPFANFKKMARL